MRFPEPHKVYVTSGSERSNTLTIIDGNTRQIVRRLALDYTLVGVAVDDTWGLVYVASKAAGTITVLDAWFDESILAGWRRNAESIWDVALDPDRGLLYVTAPLNTIAGFRGLIALDAYSGDEQWRVSLSALAMSPNYVALNPRGHVFVTMVQNEGGPGAVAVIDPDLQGLVKNLPLGKAPAFMAIDPDSSTLYVSNLFDGTISIIKDDR